MLCIVSSKIVGENNIAEILVLPGIFVDFNSGPKVPFPGVLDIGEFHSPRMKPCKSAEFHQGQFPHCSAHEARRVQHFPHLNLESIFITKNIFILKNATDFGKTVETGVDPCLRNCPLGESPTTIIVRLNVGTCDCEGRTFLLSTS